MARCDGVHGVAGQYAGKRREGPFERIGRAEGPYEALWGDAGGSAVSISPATAVEAA
jgi:hypothetical protein